MPTLALALLIALAPADVPRLNLVRAVDDESGIVDRGAFTVWENRTTRGGRTLDLDVAVLRAHADDPAPDPVFFFAGGPGVAVADEWQRFADYWMRQDRDVVLVSQRGTGGSNRLDCDAPGSDDDLQGYLDQVFADPEGFRECLDALREQADLRWYGSATAMEDVDDLRRALGYGKINVIGGSYGSRAALEYVRRHGEHVRSAIVSGVAPVAFINPLYHASAAQRAVDLIFAECAADPACNAAYPDLARKLRETLDRLDEAPAKVEVIDGHEDAIELVLTRDAFAEALRMLMYFDSRRIPYLVQSAFDGEYGTYVQASLASNRSTRDAIAFGMLLCVTCGEDIPRIDAALIDDVTDGTFLGDIRVRQQMAVCALWPESNVPDDHGAPLRSEVPVLLLSGMYDPVTEPRFAEETARHLTNALHVVAPGSHGVGGECIEQIKQAFLAAGSVEGIDTSCVGAMDLGAFYVEKRD